MFEYQPYGMVILQIKPISMIKSILLNSFDSTFGLVTIFILALIFFLLTWLGLRKFILESRFLQKPTIRHIAQVLSGMMVGMLTYVKQDESGTAANSFNRIVPEFIHTPLLVFFMLCFAITLLPNKSPSQNSDALDSHTK